MFTVSLSPSLSGRVTAGVVALDFVEPLWFVLVDEYRLDIASDTRCPLGQLWGRFSRGLKALDIPENDAHLYGFDSPTALGEPGYFEWGPLHSETPAAREYAALSRMWRHVVRRKMSVRDLIM